MCKLADVVTSLWLGNIIVLSKELFNIIIFGINEGVSVKHIVDFYFNTDGNSTK